MLSIVVNPLIDLPGQVNQFLVKKFLTKNGVQLIKETGFFQARGFDKGHALAAVAAYKKAIAAAPKSNLKKDKLIKFVNDTKKKIDVISEKLSSHLDG